MLNSMVASWALFATSVTALGSAAVVNNCPYDVSLSDVPASGGGYSQTNQVLQTGESWSHQWTELTNGAGWSIKLAKPDLDSNIMQYEYTYQTSTADIIWYDLSDVNGNPWDGDWEVASDLANCSPKDQAYRYATDDAYGMQVCPSDATITVTLCSGSGSGSSNSTAPSSPVVQPTSAAPSPSTSAAPAPEPSTSTLAAPSFTLPAPTAVQVGQVTAPSSSPSPAVTSTALANKVAAPSTSAAPSSSAPPSSSVEVPSSSAQPIESPVSPVQASVVVVTTTVQTTQAPAPTTQVSEAPAPTTQVTEAPAPTTQATEAPATTTAAAPAWTGPWTNWGLSPDGAVEAEDGILKRQATTFATLVSTVPTEAPSATGIAGRLSRRHHEHAAQRHRHHHAA